MNRKDVLYGINKELNELEDKLHKVNALMEQADYIDPYLEEAHKIIVKLIEELQ